ncbi:MAG: DUF2062 domain-containing protein [Dehalococcoidia bacterium]|nr:DUF2062 domain-containing protein [Dehalococcoidia bacterium]
MFRLIWRELNPAAIKGRFPQVVSLADPPDNIAIGMAVGVFLGVFPTFYMGLAFALLGSRIFKYNLIASIAGTAIATPLTGPVIIVASAALGSLITGVDWQLIAGQIGEGQIWAAAQASALTYLAGNIILCFLSTLPAYFITKQAVIEYRRKQGVIA